MVGKRRERTRDREAEKENSRRVRNSRIRRKRDEESHRRAISSSARTPRTSHMERQNIRGVCVCRGARSREIEKEQKEKWPPSKDRSLSLLEMRKEHSSSPFPSLDFPFSSPGPWDASDESSSVMMMKAYVCPPNCWPTHFGPFRPPFS